jgi:hypothetical protein
MKRTNQALWEKIVEQVKRGDKGGNPGQWSARKAQLAVNMYKTQGGGYMGIKSDKNPLVVWTKQNWMTKSGKPSLETGERYLPEKAIDSLTSEEYAATSRAKRKGMKEGKQFVPQPESVKEKVY